MHNSVCKGEPLSAGGKRQRTRKLSKPQKRQQNIGSSEGEQHTGNGEREDTCFLQHKLKQNPDAASPDVGLCETKDRPRCVGSERGLGDTDDKADGIKKEAINEFVVDMWYDLGPCPYTQVYSPEAPVSSSTEKLEIKDTTADSFTETSLQNEPAESSKPTLETTSNRISPTDAFDWVKGMKVPHSTQVYPSADREDMSGSTQAAQGKGPFRETDVAGPHGDAPISVLQPFFGCPLPNNGNSFFLQANNFPLSVHAATPYIHTATTLSPLVSSAVSRHTSLAPRHNHYYMTNLSLMKPDVAHSHVRPEPGVPAFNSCSQNYGVCSNTDQFLATAPVMPCAIGLPSVQSISVPLPSPAVGTHYFAPRHTTCERTLQSRELLYPHSLHRSSACQSSSVLLVPSHPYYVQQMPFVPLIPAVTCNSLHVDAPSCCPNLDAGTHGLGRILEETGRSLKTPTGNSAATLLRTADSMTTSAPPMETDKPCWAEKQAPCTVAPSQHSARIKVKPKMASSTDFIDPTRIKFGIDDVDSDDDVSKLNDFSDCSDKEWQPSNRDLKITCRRDGEGGNRWASKEDGFIESDGSVKKMCPRRRQRPSKESAECHECGKVFKGSYYLRRHHMSHSDVRPFQCSTCHKSFKQKAHLIGHQSVHERARKLQVLDVKHPSPKSKPLVLGSKCPGRPKKAYTEKERACKECGKVFKTVYRLKRHELSHTDLRPFSCRVCGKAFKQTGHRNEHEANHEKTKRRFLCNMCGVVFRCRSSFNNHMRSHGMEKLRLQAARSDVDGPCVDSKAENNEVCHTGYDCPYCTEKFATAQALNSHLETHVEVQQRRHVQPYSCDVCRRAFTYRHNLIKHKLSHKAPDKFAQFYKEKFQAHLASGKPSFKCTQCTKVFIRKETLAKHCKIHTGSKPFKCSICSHQFTQNVHLKVHMRKHTGSRPFQCKECNKSFIDSTALAKHIEYEACNTDNCLYRCKLCDKMHYYLGSLKKHIRKRHGAKEEDMEKHILKSERSLKRRSASQEEKYSCEVCSSSFSEKCNLVRHIKRKHAILVELLQKEMETKHANGVDKSGTSDALIKDRGLSNDTDRKLHPWLLCNIPASDVTASSEAQINSRDVTASSEAHINSRDVTASSEAHINSRDVTASSEAQINSRDVAATCELLVKSRSCKEFANTLHEAASCELVTGDVSPFSIEAHEISSPSLMPTVKMEHVHSPPRPRSTWGDTDHTSEPHNPSAEHHDAKSLLKHKIKEENTSDSVKGLIVRDFVFGQKQQRDICAHISSLCKSPCCSDEQDNISSPAETVNVQQKEFGMFANKSSTDEESSSPTDIHFLYKIGLVVSSKSKVPGKPAIQKNWDSRDHECKHSPLMSVSKSLTRLANISVGSDDPKSRREHDSKEYHNQTPKPTSYKSGSLSFLDDAYNDRGDAGTSTDDSCSAECGGEHNQGFSSSPSEGSGDEMMASRVLYGIQRSLQEGEHISRDTVHSPSEVEQQPSQVEGHSLVEHSPGEVEYHSSQEHRGLVEHHPSEVKHHPNKAEHHPCLQELSPVNCKHNFQNKCSGETLDSDKHFTEHSTVECDKQLTEHSTVECDNQVRIHPGDDNKMHLTNAAALTELDTGQPVSLVADRSDWSKLDRQGAHPQLRHALGKACLAANKVCPLSKDITRVSRAAQPCTPQQQEHTRLLDVKPFAAPAEPVGTASGVSVSLQRDSGAGQMCIISRDFSMNVKTSRVLDPNDDVTSVETISDVTSVETMTSGVTSVEPVTSGVTSVETVTSGVTSVETVTSGVTSVETMTSGVTSVETMVSDVTSVETRTSGVTSAETTTSDVTSVETRTCDSRQLSPGVIKTRQPPISLSCRTAEASWSDRNYSEQITIDGDNSSLATTPVNCCSLTSMADKDKRPASSDQSLPHILNPAASEQSLPDHIPNPAAPSIHSNSFSRCLSCHMSTVDNSKNDYEACPTESHVKYLGLLACKDAQEVKNKRTPIENLYQQYKPWLEELVRNARPRRRGRLSDKWRTAARTAKTSGSTTTVAEQLTYLRRTSLKSTENRTDSVCATGASSMKAEDSQQTVVSEASASNGECLHQEKHLVHTSTGPEKSKEQSSQTLLSGSQDSEAVPPSAPRPRSMSSTGQQPGSTASTSSSANSCKEAHPCTLIAAAATVSADGSGPVSVCAGSSPPSSTPESAVTGKQVYLCLVCHKYFTARHQLKRHAMTHTDHRPYTCDKCGRAFRQKVHLSDHVKRHQGQRPFVCAGCGKRFVLKNEMNQHIKNHCRGGLDAFKSVSVVSDKRACHTVMKDCKPLPGSSAGESVTQARLQSPDRVLKPGRCYTPGDTISNGTITLKVIESVYNQAHEEPGSCVHSTSTTPLLAAPAHEEPGSCVHSTSTTLPLAAPAATASSLTTDRGTPRSGSHSDAAPAPLPPQRLSEESVQGDNPGQ